MFNITHVKNAHKEIQTKYDKIKEVYDALMLKSERLVWGEEGFLHLSEGERHAHVHKCRVARRTINTCIVELSAITMLRDALVNIEEARGVATKQGFSFLSLFDSLEESG